MTDQVPRYPWSVPQLVAEIPDTGRHVRLVADEATRKAVAAAANLNGIDRLEAEFDVVPEGRDSFRVTGLVLGDVQQTCIVSLEPLVNRVEEPVDVLYTTADRASALVSDAEDQDAEGDDVEILTGNAIDLGALAAEFLMLGIDPYPRKQEAVFETAQDTAAGDNAFAALAALKGGGSDS